METLQRVYGISFPDAKMMKEWEKFQEEAKNRDHRKIGRVREISHSLGHLKRNLGSVCTRHCVSAYVKSF